MALHFMSDKELSRVEILRDLTAGRLTVSAAGELMGLERRQVLRLSKAYQEHGATALIRDGPVDGTGLLREQRAGREQEHGKKPARKLGKSMVSWGIHR